MLNMTVRVFSDDDMRHFAGFDLANFGPSSGGTGRASGGYNVGVGLTTHQTFRVARTELYRDFHARVSRAYNIPAAQFKLWNMVGRQNKTVRPDAPIALDTEKSMCVSRFLTRCVCVCVCFQLLSKSRIASQRDR